MGGKWMDQCKRVRLGDCAAGSRNPACPVPRRIAARLIRQYPHLARLSRNLLKFIL